MCYQQRAKPRTREQQRANRLQKYGLTLAQYDDMYRAQSGLCVVCFGPPDIGQSLCVDHCHTTGRVRGLLCHNCNKALGLLKDDPERILRLATYL